MVSFDGVKINYEINRVSPKFLIFLHGAGGDLNAWKHEVNFFNKKGFSTIAIDLRGHGLSGRPNVVDDYKLENFSRDVYEIIKKEKIKKFVLVGHSLGGMISFIFHKQHPKLAKAYIFVDSLYRSPNILTHVVKSHPLVRDFANWLLEKEDILHRKFKRVKRKVYGKGNDFNLFRILNDIENTSLKSWLFTFENIANFNAKNIAKSIKQPSLIIQGKIDAIFSIEQARTMEKMIHNSHLDILSDEDHMIPLNNPSRLEKEIIYFLKNTKSI